MNNQELKAINTNSQNPMFYYSGLEAVALGMAIFQSRGDPHACKINQPTTEPVQEEFKPDGPLIGIGQQQLFEEPEIQFCGISKLDPRVVPSLNSLTPSGDIHLTIFSLQKHWSPPLYPAV